MATYANLPPSPPNSFAPGWTDYTILKKKNGDKQYQMNTVADPVAILQNSELYTGVCCDFKNSPAQNPN